MRQCIVKCEGVDKCRSSLFLYIKKKNKKFFHTNQNKASNQVWSEWAFHSIICLHGMFLCISLHSWHDFGKSSSRFPLFCRLWRQSMFGARGQWPLDREDTGATSTNDRASLPCADQSGNRDQIKEAGTGSIEAHAKRSACTKSAQKTNLLEFYDKTFSNRNMS